MGILIV